MDTWIIFILGLVLGIPLSIVANIATPAVISYFRNSTLSRRERKIKFITYQYKRMKEYKENPSLLVLTFIEFIAWGLVFLGVMIFFSMSVDGLSDYVVSFVFFYILYFLATLISTNFGRIKKFDEYKEKITKQLIKLGGNPEELDKIDKEFEEAK